MRVGRVTLVESFGFVEKEECSSYTFFRVTRYVFLRVTKFNCYGIRIIY